MSRVLLSGFRVRVLDANGHPDVYPCRIVFTDSSTTQPKAVYSGPLVGDPALGAIVNLDAQGFGPADGIWLGTGEYNLSIQHNVGQPLNPDWQMIWTTNHVQGGFDDSNVDDTSIRFVKSVPDIRGLTILGGIVFNIGYYELNDGGQGEWRWMKDSLEVDDGGAYLIPTGQSTSTAGRWHRVIPSGGEVDVRMWGAVTAQSDVSGEIELAQQWCARTSDDTGITLAFPAGFYNLATASLTLYDTGLTMSGTSKSVQYHIHNGAQFTGAYGAKLYINGATTIDSTSMKVFFSPISVYIAVNSMTYVRPIWFGGSTESARITTADTYGLPIHINYNTALTSNKTITNRVVLEAAGAISMTATLKLNGGITVLGSPRIALGVGVNGAYDINQQEINAWWFGYGSLPDNDQSVALAIALNAGELSNSTVVIEAIEAPKGIYSACGAPGQEVQARITGQINIYNGANLFLTNVQADRKHIFNIIGTSAAPVTIQQGVVFPEWFGAKSGQNSNTAFHYMSQCFYRGAANGIIRWIDGGGNAYALTETLYVSGGSVGYRDIGLVITTQTANTAAIYIGDETTNTTNYEFKDVLVIHTSNGERRPTFLFDHAYDVFLRDSRINSAHGIAITCYGGGRMNISGNNINLTDGAIMWANPTLKADVSNVDFFNNNVTGVNNKVYGTSPTVQTLPNLFSHIYNNKFISEDAGAVIKLCRDSTLDAAGGQIQLHDNIFMGCSLSVLTKFMADIHHNVFRQVASVYPQINFVTLSEGEVVTGLYIRNNQGKVVGDFTTGNPNTAPSVFGCGIWGNDDKLSLCTHTQQIIQRTYADTDPNTPIRHLFPGASITSLQVTMLSTNSTRGGTSGYGYAIIGSCEIHQNEFGKADAGGKFFISNTRANNPSGGDARDWVQWSCNVGTSNYGPV